MTGKRTGKSGVDVSSHPALAGERRRERKRRFREPLQKRSLLIQLGIFVFVLASWGFPIFNPFKLLVVLFHELSHVFAVYLTGGIVFGIAIDPGGAGATMGMGGEPFLIVAAGYIGSLIIGIVLYCLSTLWDETDVWLGMCGLILISLMFGWLNDFSAVFAYGTMAMMGLGFFIDAQGKSVVIRVIAMACCLYPIIDVLGEAFSKNTEGFYLNGQFIGSDVAQLTAMTGWPPLVIAAGWLLFGVIAVYVLIRWSVEMEATMEFKRKFFRERRLDKYLDEEKQRHVVR